MEFQLPDWLTGQSHLHQAIGLIALALTSILVYLGARRWILRAIGRLVERSKTKWDDAIYESNVLTRLAHVAPAVVAYYGVELIPGVNQTLLLLVQRVSIALIVVVVALSIGALLTAANTIYASRPENLEKPIKGYLQVVKIVVYIMAGISAVATLMDRSPLLFLSGIGAMTAILLLVFKDTILSLVASIQLTGNDMVKVGDWIEMPQFGADGDVVDVALHTVKVQNWDKTITTIPTHRLISDSFKNWRGMSETGARRIKRALRVDLSTVRFLEDEEIDRLGRYALIAEYIATKRAELNDWNSQPGRNPTFNADIRRLTNLGTFRAYVEAYLRAHPAIDQQLTLIVRQLQPDSQGVPLEVYAFANDTRWAVYEGIQADIFDHLFAIAREFELRLFQVPSGYDLAGLTGEVKLRDPV